MQLQLFAFVFLLLSTTAHTHIYTSKHTHIHSLQTTNNHFYCRWVHSGRVVSYLGLLMRREEKSWGRGESTCLPRQKEKRREQMLSPGKGDSYTLSLLSWMWVIPSLSMCNVIYKEQLRNSFSLCVCVFVSTLRTEKELCYYSYTVTMTHTHRQSVTQVEPGCNFCFFSRVNTMTSIWIMCFFSCVSLMMTLTRGKRQRAREEGAKWKGRKGTWIFALVPCVRLQLHLSLKIDPWRLKWKKKKQDAHGAREREKKKRERQANGFLLFLLVHIHLTMSKLSRILFHLTLHSASCDPAGLFVINQPVIPGIIDAPKFNK